MNIRENSAKSRTTRSFIHERVAILAVEIEQLKKITTRRSRRQSVRTPLHFASRIEAASMNPHAHFVLCSLRRNHAPLTSPLPVDDTPIQDFIARWQSSGASADGPF